MAVADGGIGGGEADAGDAGLEGEHGLEGERGCGWDGAFALGGDAVDEEAGADEVKPGGRFVEESGAVAGVDRGQLGFGGGELLDYVFEAAQLVLGEGCVVFGGGEVGEDTGAIEVWQLLEFMDEVGQFFGGGTEAAHAGIDFQVDLGGCVEFAGLLGDPLEFLLAGYREHDAVSHGGVDFIG